VLGDLALFLDAAGQHRRRFARLDELTRERDRRLTGDAQIQRRQDRPAHAEINGRVPDGRRGNEVRKGERARESAALFVDALDELGGGIDTAVRRAGDGAELDPERLRSFAFGERGLHGQRQKAGRSVHAAGASEIEMLLRLEREPIAARRRPGVEVAERSARAKQPERTERGRARHHDTRARPPRARRACSRGLARRAELRPREQKNGVCPSESERVGDGGPHLAAAALAHHMNEIARDVRLFEAPGGRKLAACDGQHRDGRFDGARGAERVTDLPFAR
jgi:hypothetical protein